MLAASGCVEFSLQFLIPIVLVRSLTADDFGKYRILMLTAGTALALAPAFMPQSLFYFLPRAARGQHRVVIGTVLAYLVGAGIVVAIVSSPVNPLVGAALRETFAASHGASALFLLLWMVVSISTVLPVAEGRVSWRVVSDVSIATFRVVAIGLAAAYTHRLSWVIWALAIETLLRFGVLCAYLATRAGARQLAVDAAVLRSQLRYALPFAIGAALFVLRAQADQWIAASMLSHAAFAAFTIGAVVLPVATLVRQPINSAVLPHISEAYAANDVARIVNLLSKSNHVTALILLPVAGVLFAVAPELVSLVFTPKYEAATPVMRIYLLGIMFQSIATGYAFPSLNMGALAMRINLGCLVFSVACSLLGVYYLGLAGAAIGSVLAFAISEGLNFLAIGKRLGRASTEMLPVSTILRIGLGIALGNVAAVALGGQVGGNLFFMVILKALVCLLTATGLYLVTGGMAELRLLRSSF